MTIKQKFESLKQLDNQTKLSQFSEKYKDLFQVETKILCQEIIKVFKEKLPDYKVNPVYQALSKPPYTETDDKDFSKYRVSVSLATNKNDKINSIFLVEDLTLDSEEIFTNKSFYVDTFKLLMNDELLFAEIVHEGCWKAITENLKKKLVAENKTTDI